MEAILQLIGNYGFLVVIAGIFVWQSVQTDTQNNKMLKSISESNKNIATSLELLSKSQTEAIALSHSIEEKVDKINLKGRKVYEQ